MLLSGRAQREKHRCGHGQYQQRLLHLPPPPTEAATLMPTPGTEEPLRSHAGSPLRETEVSFRGDSAAVGPAAEQRNPLVLGPFTAPSIRRACADPAARPQAAWPPLRRWERPWSRRPARGA